MAFFLKILYCITFLTELSAVSLDSSYIDKVDDISVNPNYDTVEISGLWFRKSFYEKETKMLSGASSYYFLMTDKPDTIRIRDIAKYANCGNITDFVLDWNSEADLFFATFRDFPEWKEIYKIHKPYGFVIEGCKKITYKRDLYMVCEYKLRCIKRTIAKEDLKKSVFLANYHHYNDADSSNIYLEIERLYRKPW